MAARESEQSIREDQKQLRQQNEDLAKQVAALSQELREHGAKKELGPQAGAQEEFSLPSIHKRSQTAPGMRRWLHDPK